MSNRSWVDDVSHGGHGGLSADISRIEFSSMGGKSKAGLIHTRKAKLEAELKLLEWHKLANDAALKVINILVCN